MAIRILESNNERITFKEGAMLNKFAFVNQNGFLTTSPITIDSGTPNVLRISAGYLAIQGYRIQLTEDELITFTGTPANKTEYWIIGSLEVFEDDEIEFNFLKVLPNYSFRLDDLTVSAGVYQVVVAKVFWDGTTLTDLSVPFRNLSYYNDLTKYLPLSGGQMTGPIFYDNHQGDTLTIVEDQSEEGYPYIKITNSDGYKAVYKAGAINITNGYIELDVDIEESRIEFSLGDRRVGISPDGIHIGSSYLDEEKLQKLLALIEEV